MKFKYLVITSLLAFPLFGFAQQTDPLLQDILKKLEAIKSSQDALRIADIRAAVQKVEAGASSGGAASAFYEDAIKATQYAGKKDDAKNYEEWRKREMLGNRSAAMQEAIRLNLRYIALAIKWNGPENKQALLPELRSYIQALLQAENTFRRTPPLSEAGKKLMTDPITGNLFVAWLKLESLLPSPAIWEPSPANLGGIYEKTLRPMLRNTKNQELIDTWAKQIQVETERATNQQLALGIDNFNRVQRPRLVWQQAEDMVLIGENKQGYLQMLMVIQTNPKHADQSKWINRLEELIAKDVPAPAPAEVPVSAAPATETAPVSAPMAETPPAPANPASVETPPPVSPLTTTPGAVQ